MMKVVINRFKKLSFVLAGFVFAAALLITAVPGRTATDEDGAALYKAKCVACHGGTAEKKFDATKADDELVQIVLKGKKLEKPPNMPAYEEKGITAEQAKALITFMKSQKQ
jgi:mono/diheme cytochrome c family protein